MNSSLETSKGQYRHDQSSFSTGRVLANITGHDKIIITVTDHTMMSQCLHNNVMCISPNNMILSLPVS